MIAEFYLEVRSFVLVGVPAFPPRNCNNLFSFDRIFIIKYIKMFKISAASMKTLILSENINFYYYIMQTGLGRFLSCTLLLHIHKDLNLIP